MTSGTAPHDPALADVLVDRAHAAQAAGRFEEAEALYAAAVQAAPGAWRAHHDRGGFYKLTGRLAEAEESLRRAHDLAPSDARTRHALGIVLLSQGRYREGWTLYDARHDIPDLRLFKPQLPFPEWRGEPLAGRKLLIFPEQGLGDQIQFARFAPWLAALGADVTLLCHPTLATLFRDSLGVRVVAAAGQVEFPDPDVWVMSGSITGRAGLEPEDLPAAPYLEAPVPTTPPGARIGVATRGNPAHANDANRSLPADAAAELLALPGAISLLPEDTGAQDFAETAALVAGLDLVISVDTSIAHLAAAMGKPTWILLPRLMTDWRWMDEGEASPWYPTARLIRQAVPGDWTRVVRAVRADVEAGRLEVAAPPPRPRPAPRAAAAPAVPAPAPASDALARAAVRMVPRGARVLGLGADAAALERLLPQGATYVKADAPPATTDADLVVALGLADPAAALPALHALARPVLLSHADDPRWPALLAQAGFRSLAEQPSEGGQVVRRLAPDPARAAPEKSVWVLTYRNVENFGDRLGVHLLSHILPPNARVRHIHHKPWDPPLEGEADLLVVGIGNSLFQALLTDELPALMDRAKARVGIFGTQYREALPAERLHVVIDRCDAWYARAEEDLLLYGRGRPQARHMGDWLIHAFQLAEPSRDEMVNLDDQPPPDPALDRTIEYIQSFRRVFSPRLHPLLCALTSAEEVAYREQRPPGARGEPSGKFRSLLLDVFGVEKPEGQFWSVDRAAVAAYKARVAENVEDARRTIARLLA